MEFSGLIRYLRDCYDADNRRSTLWNIFQPAIEHRLFFTGTEDLITGNFPRTAIDTEKGTAAQQAAYLYRKEKALLHCSLFLIGSVSVGNGQPQIVCAPLLLHPAAFESNEHGHLFLRIDTANRQWNYRILDGLQHSDADETPYTTLADTIGLRNISEQEIGDIIAILQRHIPSICCTALYTYPKLASEQEVLSLIKAMKKNPEQPPMLIPASAAVLIAKSVGTRGILNELSAIAQTPALSTPLRILLSGSSTAQTPSSAQAPRYHHIPAVLSSAQKRILASTLAHPVTLAIGPPGTGKSFTIACIAAEYMSQGKSVLIASQMGHALDVIANKIEHQLQLPQCFVRVGKRHSMHDFRKRVEHLLNGISLPDTSSYEKPAVLLRRLTELEQHITTLEQYIRKQQQREQRHKQLFFKREEGRLHALRYRFLLWRLRRKKSLSTLHQELETRIAERCAIAAQYLTAQQAHNTISALRKHRKELLAFLQALRARTGNRQQQFLQSITFSALFRVFPLWLTKLSDIHDTLPLEQELFDIAIIDEATQCDIASSIPILQRAKRVLIVGDPHQLRHISFLSNSYQHSLLNKHELDISVLSQHNYRDHSILDTATMAIQRQEQVVFLNEHYRSAPPIIGFSNKMFYDNALHIMTALSGTTPAESLALHDCSGQQTAQGYNAEEAERLLRDVAALVERERLSGVHSSIGILSPFRSQVEYISKQLGTYLSMEAIERHNIITGTAYSFQGEERDAMFLSCAIDNNSHHSRFRWLNKRDALNVAITRARQHQSLYTSLSPAGMHQHSLVQQYFHYINTLLTRPATTTPDISVLPLAVQRLYRELTAHGFTVHVQYPIANTILDILAIRSTLCIGIEMVGFPHSSRHPLSIEQYNMLYRAGVRCVPVSFAQWTLHPDTCIAQTLCYCGIENSQRNILPKTF